MRIAGVTSFLPLALMLFGLLALASWLFERVPGAPALPSWAGPVAAMGSIAMAAVLVGRGSVLARAPPAGADSRVARWLAREEPLGVRGRGQPRAPEPPSQRATAPLLRFRVPDDLPVRALRRATAAALDAARDALPARGKVRASASIEDVPGPESVVGVRLELVADRVDRAWVIAARDAFEREFLARVEGSALHAGGER